MKEVFKGKIFQVLKKDVEIDEKIKEFEIARRSPGTRIIIVKDKKILINKEFRYEYDEEDYRLPGGKVFDSLQEFIDFEGDILEKSEEAAKKEILEECGVEAEDLKLFKISKSGATIEWNLYYFICENFEEGKEQNLEFGENITCEWKSFEEVKELCLNGKVKEDRSVGVLLRFLS